MTFDKTMDADSAIAIVDCNNFYASCERVVNPALQDRPVVVLSHNDGIIVSRSNEVKALGVPNASPFFQHRELLERHNTAVFEKTKIPVSQIQQVHAVLIISLRDLCELCVKELISRKAR